MTHHHRHRQERFKGATKQKIDVSKEQHK